MATAGALLVLMLMGSSTALPQGGLLLTDPILQQQHQFVTDALRQQQQQFLLPPSPFFLSLIPDRTRSVLTPGSSASQPASEQTASTDPDTTETPSNEIPSRTSTEPTEASASGVSPDITFALSQSQLDFTLELDRSQLATGGNSVFSPLSIVSILNLLLMGADNMTYLQLRKALRYLAPVDESIIHEQYHDNLQSALSTDSGVQVSISNRLFPQQGVLLKESFLTNAETYYNTKVESLNYASPLRNAYRYINQWVRLSTNNKIPQLLDRPLPTDTRMVAVNTIYFNGSWEVPFDVNQTKTRSFTISPSESVEVDMMVEMLEIPYGENSELGLKIIGLPYKNKHFAMFVLLPTEKSLEGLNKLETRLNSTVIETLINSMTREEVAVNLPRFKLEQKMYIKDLLAVMGVTDVFDPSLADLGRMVDLDHGEQLYVNNIVHQAVVDVSERGTEASAATSTSFLRDRFAKTFHADHPFIFFIRDNASHATLFWGRVVRP